MLAPRKKLWSTPSSAIDIALDFADLDENDVVYDVGCGDGRVLIQMASLATLPSSSPINNDRDETTTNIATDDIHDHAPNNTTGGTAVLVSEEESNNPQRRRRRRRHRCHRFLGIEISSERAAEARTNILRAKESGDVSPHVSIDVICANALDIDAINYDEATVIFLYLVPRGLRLIREIVWPTAKYAAGGGREGGDEEGDEGGLPDRSASSTDTANGRPSSRRDENETICLAAGAGTERDEKKRPRRIITYMSPFENATHLRKERCMVEHQEGAAWPVYLYHVDQRRP